MSLSQLAKLRYMTAAYTMVHFNPANPQHRAELAILSWLENRFPQECHEARCTLLRSGPAGYEAYDAVTC